MSTQINSWPDSQGALEGSYCRVVLLSHFEARGGTIAALGQSGIGCHLQAKVGRLVGRDAG